MAKVVVVTSGKGGVGKTTSTAALGAALAWLPAGCADDSGGADLGGDDGPDVAADLRPATHDLRAPGSDGARPLDLSSPPSADLAIADASTPDLGAADLSLVGDLSSTPDLATTVDAATACGACPVGYTCGTANGIPVCRSATGIPLFSHVFVIVMENTSWATLDQSTTPFIHSLKSNWAYAADYHGVTHPSLPNYVALVSGDTQGIGDVLSMRPRLHDPGRE
jgi:hypothetical protein